MSTDTTIDTERDLVLTRLIDASPEAVYRCWTEPALMTQWFAPKPWSTPRATVDLRVGGGNVVVMADEAGNEYHNPGQYLEIVPNKSWSSPTPSLATGSHQPSRSSPVF